MGCMRSYSSRFKVFFGVVAVVGFIWLLLVATLHDEDTKPTETTVRTQPAMANLKHVEVFREDSTVNPGLDLTYMSKRRVPNGPDPIHNRRAGNSRRPPGRA